MDLPLIGYADDVLNLSRSLHGLEADFIKLRQEYAHIGLRFNAKKSEVLLLTRNLTLVGASYLVILLLSSRMILYIWASL